MGKINNLVSVCVRNSDGSIDVEETMNEFSNQVTTLAEVESALRETISVAVNAVFDSVFDTWGDKPITMPTLCAFAAQEMSVRPEDYTETLAAIRSYVQNNVTTFKVKKGFGGGVKRRQMIES